VLRGLSFTIAGVLALTFFPVDGAADVSQPGGYPVFHVVGCLVPGLLGSGVSCALRKGAGIMGLALGSVTVLAASFLIGFLLEPSEEAGSVWAGYSTFGLLGVPLAAIGVVLYSVFWLLADARQPRV
jgi:hypothetical protein